MSYILICSYVYVNVTHIGHIQCSHLGVDLLVYKDNEHVYHMLNMHWWGLTKNAKFQYIISAKLEFRINWDFFSTKYAIVLL